MHGVVTATHGMDEKAILDAIKTEAFWTDIKTSRRVTGYQIII